MKLLQNSFLTLHILSGHLENTNIFRILITDNSKRMVIYDSYSSYLVYKHPTYQYSGNNQGFATELETINDNILSGSDSESNSGGDSESFLDSEDEGLTKAEDNYYNFLTDIEEGEDAYENIALFINRYFEKYQEIHGEKAPNYLNSSIQIINYCYDSEWKNQEFENFPYIVQSVIPLKNNFYLEYNIALSGDENKIFKHQREFYRNVMLNISMFDLKNMITIAQQKE